MSRQQIIAMGGGGFSMEPENLLLDQYILSLVNKEKPKVCFVPTASGDAEDYIARFYASYQTLPSTPSHLSLFKPPHVDLRTLVLEQDIIYVGGGSTKNLLALWKEWELDKILKEAWKSSIILAGLSAGSICWFEQGVTDSLPGELIVLPCLGLLQGSNCPHYDGELERRPAYHRLLSAGKISDGYAADDGVALHFIENRLEQIVSSRPYAKAYRLQRMEDGIQETPLETVDLGAGLAKNQKAT
ncbi:peptidase E [Gloeocapsopsis crepidinum LEGE 06123]|uniref:Peptidase E n=2 Tax=Gloeocapsopsis crepidinum TaxID=693223 RepID=A0ABR9UWQ6_9CHRO|nr:peptidase E [Gloeocapsopsis crepidinum LEGE 06123]